MAEYTDDTGVTAIFHGIYRKDCEPVAVISKDVNGVEISSPYTQGMITRNLGGGDEQLTIQLSPAEKAAHNSALTELNEFEANGSHISTLKNWNDYDNPSATPDHLDCGVLIGGFETKMPGLGSRA